MQYLDMILTIISFLPLLLIDLLDGPELLLELHPAVLEPDLDLSLGEAERVRDLDPAPPSEIVIEVKLLLQLQRLEPGVGLAAAPPGTPVGTFNDCLLVSVRDKVPAKLNQKEAMST